eukprot:482170-Prorocentrum_minimum.AAC.2
MEEMLRAMLWMLRATWLPCACPLLQMEEMLTSAAPPAVLPAAEVRAERPPPTKPPSGGGCTARG